MRTIESWPVCLGQRLERDTLRRLEVLLRWMNALDLNPDMRSLLEESLEEMRDLCLRLLAAKPEAAPEEEPGIELEEEEPAPGSTSLEGWLRVFELLEGPQRGQVKAVPAFPVRPAIWHAALLPCLVEEGNGRRRSA